MDKAFSICCSVLSLKKHCVFVILYDYREPITNSNGEEMKQGDVVQETSLL